MHHKFIFLETVNFTILEYLFTTVVGPGGRDGTLALAQISLNLFNQGFIHYQAAGTEQRGSP